LDYPAKKIGGGTMIGKVVRGTYVFVVTAMVVAWVVSLGKEAPAEPQSSPQTWNIYS
jgi:hypothetical protein